jgi:hypothetical protein
MGPSSFSRGTAHYSGQPSMMISCVVRAVCRTESAVMPYCRTASPGNGARLKRLPPLTTITTN